MYRIIFNSITFKISFSFFGIVERVPDKVRCARRFILFKCSCFKKMLRRLQTHMWTVIYSNLIVAIIWGIMPHVNRMGLKGTDPAIYSALRHFCGLVFLVCLLMIKLHKKVPMINHKRLWVAPLAGVLASISISCYVWSIKHTSSPSSVTSFVYPMSLTLSVLVGKYIGEKIYPVQKIGIILAIIACFCLTQKNIEHS